MTMPRKTARLLSAAGSVNATLVKANAVTLFHIQGYNARGSAVYLKLYNKATAPDETDTPVKTLYLPTAAAFIFDFDQGYEFTTGLGYRLTTGGADNDTGALTAADILALNLDYSG